MKVRQGFDQLLKDAQGKRKRADAEHRVLSNCKLWLECQPHDTVLEPVTVAIDGYHLASVRSRLKQCAGEISALNNAPVPASDIRDRLATYVQALGRQATPTVRGVGEGASFDVRWPLSRVANRMNLQDFDRDGANPLFMAAFLFPERMIDHLHALVEQAASDPLPVKDRAARVAVLNAEIVRLRRIEEALMAQAIEHGETVTRSVDAPAWAILGVKVASVKPVNKRGTRVRAAE